MEHKKNKQVASIVGEDRDDLNLCGTSEREAERKVLNKRHLGNPNLNMNSADFGQIPASQVFGARQFQALLRFSF